MIYKLMKSSRLKDLNFTLKKILSFQIYSDIIDYLRCTTCWFDAFTHC